MENESAKDGYSNYHGLNDAEKEWLARTEKKLKAEKRAEHKAERRIEQKEAQTSRDYAAQESKAANFRQYLKLCATARRRGTPLTEAEICICFLAEFYDRPASEIAKALGLSNISVRVHISEGYRKLFPGVGRRGRKRG